MANVEAFESAFNKGSKKQGADGQSGAIIAGGSGGGGLPGMIKSRMQNTAAKKQTALNQSIGAIKGAGKPAAGLDTSQPMQTAAADTTPKKLANFIPQAKHGGRVMKAGLVHVHRGERIIPAKHSRKRTSGKQRTITKA